MCTHLKRIVTAFARVFCSAVMLAGLASTAYAQWDIDIYPNSGQVTAGNNVGYDFYVENDSGSTRDNVAATITLPDNSRFVASSVDCDQSAAPVIECDLGNMAGNEIKEFSIVIKVLDDFVATTNGAGFFSYPVEVSADSGTPGSENAPVVYVNELADLSVSLFASTTTPRAGETFSLSMVVDNFGPSSARTVETYTRLGSGGIGGGGDLVVTIQSCAFSVTQGCGTISQFSCTTGPVTLGQFGNDVATMATNILRSVMANDPDCGDSDPPGTAPVGRLRGSFRIVTEQDLDLSALILAESDTPDSDYSNNESTILFDSTGVADLSISKTATGEMLVDGQQGLPYNIISGAPFPEAPEFTTSPLVVTQGRRIRYELEVENDGPSKAENVVVTDRLPPGVTVVPGTLAITDINGTQISGSCQFGTPGDVNDRMTCGLGTMQAAAVPTPPANQESYKKITFDVVVDVDLAQGTILTNNALVSSDQFEDDNSDNLVTAFSVVSPLVGIAGCSVGGPYSNIACSNGTASIALSGFGFALPEAGALSYAWTSDCPGGAFSDASISSPTFGFVTANPDNSPVSCQVQLNVSNVYANSSCSGAVTVVDCSVDCNGVLGGSAALDRCGVCQGDGTACLGCSQVDVSDTLTEALLGSLRIQRLTGRTARKFAAAAGTSGAQLTARRLRLAARRQFNLSKAALAAVPTEFQSCTNAQFCLQASNAGALSDASASSTGAVQIFKRALGKLRKATGNRRVGQTALRQVNAIFERGQLALAGVPLNSSSCS